MCDKILRELEESRDKRGEDCWENLPRENRESPREFGGYGREKSSPEWPPRLSTWCPRANIYYAYTEDTNPFERIEEFVDYKRNNPDEDHRVHFDPPLDPFAIRDPYEENAARAKFLRDAPVSFVIFGKPGLDTDKLGELISQWWRCVLVSPKSLVRDEIDRDTDKGRWISETLENGETLDRSVYTNLIECRIQQRDVMNRGYVIEGLPLIPEDPEVDHSTCPRDKVVEGEKEKCCEIEADCKQSSYASSTSTSSSSNSDDGLANLPTLAKSPFQRRNIDLNPGGNLFLRRTTIQETLREVQTTVTRARINPFATESSGKIVSERHEDYIPEQIERIFESWPLKPTVIIYVSCPDEDVFQRRENFTFDPFVDFPGNLGFPEMGETRGDHDERLEANLIERVSDIANLKLRCEIYRLHALPAIERRILEHNPQNVVRIDGRASVSQMFEVVSTRLRILPLSRAIIPRRIWESKENEEAEETARLDDDAQSNERVFSELSRKFTISSAHRWSLSDWKFTCPVELTMGRRIAGKAEYAVRFMNKIFFLSSATTMQMFLENPRPFVASMRPKPSCKIAIFGPRYSGKSELSEALARNYRANVINVRELTREMIDERIETNVAQAVRQSRDRVIEDLRLRLENEREAREIARIDALNLWYERACEILREFDEFRRADSPTDHDNSEIENATIIRKNLRDFGLEVFENDAKLLRAAIKNKTKIYDHAPENLRDEEPPIRDLSEHDPEVAAILENEVSHLRDSEIDITSLEIAGTLISRIKMIPAESIDGELTREASLIVDGMCADPEVWRIVNEAGVSFDDLILVRDESPYENLLRYWQRRNEIDRDFGEGEREQEEMENERFILDRDNYIAEIEEFEKNWLNFSPLLEETGRNILICEFGEIAKMYEDAVNHIEHPYRPVAKIITQDDEDNEETVGTITDIEDDDDESENPDETRSKGTREDNRRYGDTGIYCPVALARNKILWRGKNEHVASFLDKIYLCSSDEALQDFVRNPGTFNVPYEKPSAIPPARICLVGPPGTGKSTICRILSREFATRHVDFTNLLRNYAQERGVVDEDPQDPSLEIDLPLDPADSKYSEDGLAILAFIRKYQREGAILPKRILDECILKFFKHPHDDSALMIDSFPNCLEDVEVALDNYLVPDLVVELECSLSKIQDRLLPMLLEEFVANRGFEAESEEEEEEEEEEETMDEARERISREIEETHERKREMLDRARMRMQEESVSWIVVNNDGVPEDLLKSLRELIRSLVHRDSSIIEETRRIDPYRADELLECGYYMTSTFGRSCPVQIYERKNPFQTYIPMDDRNEIHPIQHRHYVYFVAGEEAAALFAKDPLRYIREDSCDPIVPARLAIVGPPKSGKTTLARRLERDYGLRVVEREEALRWMRKNYKWTRTSMEIEQSMRDDREIGKKLLARAIQLYCADCRSSTQGWILDGFPRDREETEELALLDIRPTIVVNLQADRDFCLITSIGEKSIAKNSIEQLYEKWESDSPTFLHWLTKYWQNVVSVDATASKWAVWRQAKREISSILIDVKRYHREADYEKVHSLKSLCVTPYELLNRQSSCEFFCPCCLHCDETIEFSGSPPDRRGAVQFRDYFYWICPRHYGDFARSPTRFLPPLGRANLPAERPKSLNDEIDVEHACWAKRLVASGNCIVTYVDSQEERAIVPGKRNIGALYRNDLYLFCTLECRAKFLSRTGKYAGIVINVEEISTAMTIKRLTNLEYLEKRVARHIVKSILEVAANRPKYPGFSAALSAAIFIGIYLKINDNDSPLGETEIYEIVRERMLARSRIVKVATRNIKKIINPHVNVSKNLT